MVRKFNKQINTLNFDSVIEDTMQTENKNKQGSNRAKSKILL